ncbi:long-chain acyl-CoA synthetase [Jatrophihabitans sp. GAS493]|uniref:class I adenylate-forming enzyme family protein n=1 Tax=Jatrophihabitans sp. GAS493 TaxID=1907575 RepID=UPI000BC0B654|nr:AMP-binding protein [Jatrophihabitans sp. GAS493]SOD71472.1 long-chain acyl-CoA synthetase [Jatrophihabitans sp. GAS493]
MRITISAADSIADARMLTQPCGASLGLLEDAALERFGESSLLVFEGAVRTNADLAAQARRLATGLADIGVRLGDRVAVCMANCPEVLVAYRAIWRMGAAVTPLLFLLSEDELRHAIRDSAATLVITTPKFLPKVQAATTGLTVRCVTTGRAPEGAAGSGVITFDELSSGAEAALIRVGSQEMAALLYTGGTTGRAKGVVLSHDALSAAAWSATLAGVEEHYAVTLLPLPLAHVYGLMVSSMGLHAVQPSRAVLMRWFEPAAWLQLAQDEQVEVGVVVPTMLRLLATQPLESYNLSRLRRLVSGSAPLPAEIREEWARRAPHVEVVEGYGCSETAALATSTPPHAGRPGSVGTAAPGVGLRIEDSSGATVGPNVDGEVCVQTLSIMSGYWHDAESTAEALHDGWLHTGDIGHLDDDGYLFIVDRLKDLIIRGGFNVYPRDVEEVLMRHPEVAVCGVVGRPDVEHGEEVVAFVQLKPDARVTAAELIGFAKEHLSAVKYPREIHLIDQLPLTSIGKLDRKALRQRLELSEQS